MNRFVFYRLNAFWYMHNKGWWICQYEGNLRRLYGNYDSHKGR